MRLSAVHIALLAIVALAPACAADDVPTTDEAGSQIEVTIGALQLVGIADACYDLEVVNDSGDRVFARRITSGQFGNALGDVSYVGPCDASLDEADSFIYLDVVGLYSGAATCGDTFSIGDDFDSNSLPFNDSMGILEAEATCVANADVPINFDVTILRPANHGFFDVAVEFDNIFCSAKFDCCADANADGLCDPDEYARLLHNGDVRDTTVVLGLVCTGGTGAADTTLLLNEIYIDCGAAGYAAIDPTGPDGTQYGTSFVDDVNGFLFEVGKYQGEEQLGFNKRYLDIAIGLDTDNLAGLNCSLITRATADNFNTTGGASEQFIAAGTVYPYIDFHIPLWAAEGGMACAEEALNGTDSNITIAYTATDASEDECFDFSYPEVVPGGNCGPGS
ncbi:MAG: hypothetical protein ACI9MR_005205 [Myxococcota bacterium]|jgi:hypothetical protein